MAAVDGITARRQVRELATVHEGRFTVRCGPVAGIRPWVHIQGASPGCNDESSAVDRIRTRRASDSRIR